MKKLAFLVILSSLILSPALAGRPIDETVAADPDGDVSIELIAGSIRLVGWNRSAVQVSGTVGDDVEEVEISTSRGRVEIEVKLVDEDDDDGERRSLEDADADLEIHVPTGSSVEVEAISAGIVIQDLTGDLEVESISGDVEISGAPRQVSASTISGGITLTADEPLEEGEFESISGKIEVRAALAPRGDFSFESISGNIELHLPADTSADFDIETFSGKIDNDFGPAADRNRDITGATSLQFTHGNGDADVEIESFSGTIRLRMD